MRMVFSQMLQMLSPVWGLFQREESAHLRDARSAMVARMASARQRVRSARRTALVVEDDPSLRRLMGEYLARMNFHVLAAAHYAAALAHLEACTPDVACVDIQLPTESGYELCEHIRGPLGLEVLPIIVTSEFRSPEEMAYAEEAGANLVLFKPFSMPELCANIAVLLDALPRGVAHVSEHGPRRAAARGAHRTLPGYSRNDNRLVSLT